MKTLFSILILCFLYPCCHKGDVKAQTVNLILDEDFLQDVDDLSGLLVAFNLHKTGVINLKAIMATSGDDASAPAVRAIRDYYGYSAIPIGAYQTEIDQSGFDNWVGAVRDQFRPTDGKANYPSSTDLYEDVLTACEDNSVVVVIAGFATPFMAAYNANPTLFNQKINKIIVIAGVYPTSIGSNRPGQNPNAEYNILIDPTGWGGLAGLASRIEWGGAELGDTGGNGFSGTGGSANPAQFGWDWFHAVFVPTHSIPVNAPNERQSWGAYAVLQAAYPATYFSLSSQGQNVINTSTGSNTFTNGTSYNQYYYTKTASDASLKTVIETHIANAMITGQSYIIGIIN